MQVHLQNLFGWIDAGLLTVALAIAGYFVLQLRAFLAEHAKWLSQQDRDRICDVAQQALRDGINYALSQLEKVQKQHEAITFPGGVKGWVGAKAAQYAADHASHEIADLGWTPDLIAQKILAKMPPVRTVEDTTGQTIIVGHVEISTLPPVSGAPIGG